MARQRKWLDERFGFVEATTTGNDYKKNEALVRQRAIEKDRGNRELDADENPSDEVS